jgi:hypothetical protein
MVNKMAKVVSGGGKKAKPPTKEDYIYAKEVAGQPAKSPNEIIAKTRAKLDVKYLEKKYPQIRKDYNVKGTTVSTINKTYNS